MSVPAAAGTRLEPDSASNVGSHWSEQGLELRKRRFLGIKNRGRTEELCFVNSAETI